MNFTGIPLLPRACSELGFKEWILHLHLSSWNPDSHLYYETFKQRASRKTNPAEPLLIAVPFSAYRPGRALTYIAHPDMASTADDQDANWPIETSPGFVTNANLNPQWASFIYQFLCCEKGLLPWYSSRPLSWQDLLAWVFSVPLDS